MCCVFIMFIVTLPWFQANGQEFKKKKIKKKKKKKNLILNIGHVQKEGTGMQEKVTTAMMPSYGK